MSLARRDMFLSWNHHVDRQCNGWIVDWLLKLALNHLLGFCCWILRFMRYSFSACQNFFHFQLSVLGGEVNARLLLNMRAVHSEILCSPLTEMSDNWQCRTRLRFVLKLLYWVSKHGVAGTQFVSSSADCYDQWSHPASTSLKCHYLTSFALLPAILFFLHTDCTQRLCMPLQYLHWVVCLCPAVTQQSCAEQK